MAGFPRRFPCGIYAGRNRDRRSFAPCWATEDANLQVFWVGKTGATGLEPATSGVTDRVGHHDARQRTPLNRYAFSPLCSGERGERVAAGVGGEELGEVGEERARRVRKLVAASWSC